MAKKLQPGIPAPTPAQRERAQELRALIEQLEAGARPATAPPATPREITDAAARRKRAAARSRKK